MHDPPTTKATVLISGEGSNLQALIDASTTTMPYLKIVRVISNKAKANGLLVAFEEELKDVAAKRSALQKEVAATRAESLMQQVRELGHLPRESQSEPQEQLLAQQLGAGWARKV